MDNLNNLKDENTNNTESKINQKQINIEDSKSPLSLFIGSMTSFTLCLFSFVLSRRITLYFVNHRPSNESEIVQSISTSLNTLIIGLAFIATFSFGFIGLGLFIVFIRSFFVKKL